MASVVATRVTPYAHPFGDAIAVDARGVHVRRGTALASDRMDGLVRDAVFGDDATRAEARWLLWELAQAVGVRPASIHEFYMARGRGEVHGFTVPAINVRGMAYHTARSIFRTANRVDAGAFICEIARSEIAYTEQRPAEYVAVILGAALREGFRGPVFIQGDHFQVNAKKYGADPSTEVEAVRQLAREAVVAGFYNIDVDTSTLVDLKRETLAEQQRLNYEVGADIMACVRGLGPAGVTVSLGERSARWARKTVRWKSCAPTWTVCPLRCGSGCRRMRQAYRKSAFSQARRTAGSSSPMARSRT